MQLFNYERIRPWFDYLFQGLNITLSLAFLAAIFGIMLGILLNVMSRGRIAKKIAFAYVDIFRGTPIILQLSMVYFAMPRLIGTLAQTYLGYTRPILLTAFTASIITFSLNSGAYISEIIRSGVNSVDPGEIEAAKALGVKKFFVYKDIILPTAFRNAFPALMNELITLVKESSIVSVIGLQDLMRRQQIVTSQTFMYFEPLIVIGLIYYVVVKIMSYLGNWLEKRWSYV